MTFDDLKRHEGQPYSGMSVGAFHDWEYPNGRWRERKVSPSTWAFTFVSTKRRRRAAPEGSGARVGTQYHWYVLAHQRVRKIDANAYDTFMEGMKHKIAHKRPHWRRWSSEYADQPGERERVIAILEDALWRLRAKEEEDRSPPTEPGAAPPSPRPWRATRPA